MATAISLVAGAEKTSVQPLILHPRPASAMAVLLCRSGDGIRQFQLSPEQKNLPKVVIKNEAPPRPRLGGKVTSRGQWHYAREEPTRDVVWREGFER